MNNQIKRLAAVSAKHQRRIIGLMSGTSLDGLDIAMGLIEGSGLNTKVIVEYFETVSYTAEFRTRLRAVCFKNDISLSALTKLNRELAQVHAAMINSFLHERSISRETVDLIASHGQTIFHAPDNEEHKQHATLQICDGDRLAVAAGIITLSDFRQKHIAAGGEGAPLAGYGDLLLFANAAADVVLINIGGISNFTFIPRSGKVICSDAGPGNTLIDLFCRQKFSVNFDDRGDLAATGIVHQPLLDALKNDAFFEKDFPKSTGQEYFSEHFLQKRLHRFSELSPADVLATLTTLTAETIADAVLRLDITGADLFISGGGKRNETLMTMLKQQLPAVNFRDTAEMGIDSDAKEAVLFALLANEAVAGNPAIFEERGLLPVSMGKISLPL